MHSVALVRMRNHTKATRYRDRQPKRKLITEASRTKQHNHSWCSCIVIILMIALTEMCAKQILEELHHCVLS